MRTERYIYSVYRIGFDSFMVDEYLNDKKEMVQDDAETATEDFEGLLDVEK